MGKGKAKGLIQEFKTFISRGNVLDMAVGVVIGSAFTAIVNSVVNVLMSLATWAVPGGLGGLVTVLPAISETQKGMILNEAGDHFQKFAAEDFNAYAKFLGAEAEADIQYGANILNSNYTLYGSDYVYKQSAIINWGAVINAVISFLIIALVLFTVVKIVNLIRKTAEDATKKLEAEIAAKLLAKEGKPAAEEEKPAEE